VIVTTGGGLRLVSGPLVPERTSKTPASGGWRRARSRSVFLHPRGQRTPIIAKRRAAYRGRTTHSQSRNPARAGYVAA